MKFGAIEIMFPSSGAAAIEEAAGCGFDGFEYYVDGPDPRDDPIWTPTGRARARLRAWEGEIEIPSVCLGFFNEQAWLTADEPDTRADARAILRRAIDVAASLGASVIQVPFFGPAEIGSKTHKDRLVEGLSAVAPAAEAAGIYLAFENTLTAMENLHLLHRIDEPAVKHYYDVGNATSLGYDAARELAILKGHTGVIHLKDGDEEGGTMLGAGDVDFDRVAASLSQGGWDGWLILETASMTDPLEDAEENLAFARDRFA